MTETTVHAIGKCIVKGCKQRKRNTFTGTVVTDRYGTHTKWGLPTPIGIMHPGCLWVGTNPTLTQLAPEADRVHRVEGGGTMPSAARHWVDAMLAHGWICHDHDRVMKIVTVRGTVNIDKSCDGRCMNATGGACDCSCGGEMHGASWG